MLELVEPLGHTDLVRGLVRSSRDNRLAHALLFEGKEGIGKYRAALWLVSALLCDRRGDAPCLECGPCKRVAAESHADVFTIDHGRHGQNATTIHFIVPREPRPKDGYQGPPVEEFLALRAAEGRGKYIIVRDADSMNEEAQNAFLKMLEEPRPGVHLILESNSPGSLLATVRSRVVPVRFTPLDAQLCDQILWRDGGFVRGEDDDIVARLSRMSGGSPGLALRLAARGVPAMQVLLGDAFSGQRPALDVATELFDVDGTFPGKTPTAQRRTRAQAILDLGMEMLIDIERLSAGAAPDGLPHGDVVLPAVGAPRMQDAYARRRASAAWIAAREDLGLNLSPEALVERALTSSR